MGKKDKKSKKQNDKKSNKAAPDSPLAASDAGSGPMKGGDYERELVKLQVELCHLQDADQEVRR